MNQELIYENLTADLFVSALMMDKVMGGSFIRKLLAHGIINQLREIYYLKPHEIQDRCIDIIRGDKWPEIKLSLNDDKRKVLAAKKAEEFLQIGLFSVNQDDDDYPLNFRHLDGMPLILYGMGNVGLLKAKRPPSVAVVGSRQPTLYGTTVTKEITKALVNHQICIVSGLARGIDTVAHEACLEAGGSTIAVLAGGLDQVYPPENKVLFERIKVSGLVLSEMPPGQKALRQYFPARNRILSGLCDVVAIMEAGEFSGTLHTASFAAAQGRDVFVVPGTIYARQSLGNLKLLQDGADLLLSAEDILERLAGLTFFQEIDNICKAKENQSFPLTSQDDSNFLSWNEEQKLIIDQLGLKEQTFNELAKAIHCPVSKLAQNLSELELSGKIIRQHQRYALTFFCT